MTSVWTSSSSIGAESDAPALAAASTTVAESTDLDMGTWPHWRGPFANGSSATAKPPITWSETENVAWKTPLPGKGHSTPVVWSDRVIVTTAVPIGDAMPPKFSGAPGAHDNNPITHKQQFVVMAIARHDGSVMWKRTVHEAIPHEGGHYTSTFASASPVTDGEIIVASFGSHGIYGLDLDGKVLWEKDLGKMHTKHGHGEGSSPVLWQDTVVVTWDHEGASFVVALDKQTGKERWRAERQEVTSWASPIVVKVGGVAQVIVSATNRVRAYDVDNGNVIWECGGLSHNVVASPVSDGERVIVGSSYETRAMFAIRLAGAKGDITDSEHVIWQRSRATPYVPSPLLYRNTVYFLRHYQGILSRLDATTGDEHSAPLRLGGIVDIYASPVAADGRVYLTGMDGVTMVMSSDQIPRLISVNRLDDRFSASAALAADAIYLRGEKHLYKLSAAE